MRPKITLKYCSIFQRRVFYIFNASWKYATIILCFGRVKNVHDASKITFKYNRIFRRRVQNVHGALKVESKRRNYSRMFSMHRKYVHGKTADSKHKLTIPKITSTMAGK